MVYKTEVSEIETKTVREVAEILGVTKQAIFKKIKQLPPELAPEKVNGTYKLSPRTVDFIVSNTQSPTVNANRLSTDNQPIDSWLETLNTIIDELKSDKTYLNKQIYIKDEQLQKQNTVPTDNQLVTNELATLKELIQELKSDKTELNERIREKDEEIKKKSDTLINSQSVEGMGETIKLLLEQKDNEVKRIEVELNDKNKQIEKLHSLIDQQQQLALQTQLQNNKLQLQLEEVEEKIETAKEVKSDSNRENKKWWQFFK